MDNPHKKKTWKYFTDAFTVELNFEDVVTLRVDEGEKGGEEPQQSTQTQPAFPSRFSAAFLQ